jgi:hypothetical protein
MGPVHALPLLCVCAKPKFFPDFNVIQCCDSARRGIADFAVGQLTQLARVGDVERKEGYEDVEATAFPRKFCEDVKTAM